MLNEQEKESLKQRTSEAWRAFHNFQYEVIEPHFYKEKKGRRMELINPWKDMKERMTTETKSYALYSSFHELRVQYWRATGEHIPVEVLWKSQETPNGIRWVKK